MDFKERPIDEVIERSIRAGYEVRVEQSQGEDRPDVSIVIPIPMDDKKKSPKPPRTT